MLPEYEEEAQFYFPQKISTQYFDYDEAFEDGNGMPTYGGMRPAGSSDLLDVVEYVESR